MQSQTMADCSRLQQPRQETRDRRWLSAAQTAHRVALSTLTSDVDGTRCRRHVWVRRLDNEAREREGSGTQALPVCMWSAGGHATSAAARVAKASRGRAFFRRTRVERRHSTPTAIYHRDSRECQRSDYRYIRNGQRLTDHDHLIKSTNLQLQTGGVLFHAPAERKEKQFVLVDPELLANIRSQIKAEDQLESTRTKMKM